MNGVAGTHQNRVALQADEFGSVEIDLDVLSSVETDCWYGCDSCEIESRQIVAVGIPGKLRLLYVPLCWGAPTVRGIEAGATYRARYFDPCTGEEVDLGAVSPEPL